MHCVMNPEPPKEPRFRRPPLGPLRDHLLAEIHALDLELREASEATAAGHVPIAARADFLRAQDAHRRAAIAWSAARGRDELRAVSEALRQCRTALESTRTTLGRR
jgi:hypothetical protein